MRLSFFLLLWMPFSVFCLSNRGPSTLCYSCKASSIGTRLSWSVWNCLRQSFLWLGMPLRSFPRCFVNFQKEKTKAAAIHIFKVCHILSCSCSGLDNFGHLFLQILSRRESLRSRPSSHFPSKSKIGDILLRSYCNAGHDDFCSSSYYKILVSLSLSTSSYRHFQ